MYVDFTYIHCVLCVCRQLMTWDSAKRWQWSLCCWNKDLMITRRMRLRRLVAKRQAHHHGCLLDRKVCLNLLFSALSTLSCLLENLEKSSFCEEFIDVW